MKKVSLAVALTVCFVLSASALCWSTPLLTADDFLPVVQAENEEQREERLSIQHPEEVKTEVDPQLNKPVTKAATAQDAINSVMQSVYADEGEGCQAVALPDGKLGVVAVGRGSYGSEMSNIVAQRREQQRAYSVAFLQAKKMMADYFSEASIEQVQSFVVNESEIDEADSGASTRNESFNETIQSITKAVLKGYVTYDVRDDVENGTVYVTLVSTPRTQGRYSRPTSNMQQAESLKDGINKIFAEIQSGVVPPVGGRIVNVPETGEIAFVGFGSEVVRPADNKRVKADNRQSARRRAILRAKASLCGIIRGDNVTASDSSSSGEERNDGDPKIDLPDPIDALTSDEEKAEAQKAAQGFRSNKSYQQVIQSAIKGTIPPGVSPKAWLDNEGAFAYAVAVYVPSVTQKTAQMNQDMKDSQIVQPYEVKKNNPAKQGKDNPQIKIDSKTYKDSGTLQPGVSGTVNQPL